MNDFLFYLISSCLFFAIIQESMGIFFHKRDVPYFISIMAWVMFYVIEIIGTTYIGIPILRLLLDIVCSLCLCLILYFGSIRKRLIWILIVNLMGMITETIVGYAFIFIGLKIDQIKVLGSFVSKIILLMILIGLKASNYSRLKRDIPFKYWCVLFFISVGNIFVLNTIFSLCYKTENKNSPIFAMISSAFILATNFLILHIYENLSERMESQKQQIIFNKQIELCKNQIQEREESNHNIRNIKHDIENHLICIKEYMDRDELDYARKYINDLLMGKSYFQINSPINSGNIVVDALLNYKFMKMQQIGIEMKTHIEIPYDMDFNDADICIILGNCLDNSIEAVSIIDDMRPKIINIGLIYRKNNLIFSITNPFVGTIVQDKKGQYITTKKDAVNHGIGLNSVEKAVKKYNGLLEISSKNGIFKVQILLYAIGKNYI